MKPAYTTYLLIALLSACAIPLGHQVGITHAPRIGNVALYNGVCSGGYGNDWHTWIEINHDSPKSGCWRYVDWAEPAIQFELPGRFTQDLNNHIETVSIARLDAWARVHNMPPLRLFESGAVSVNPAAVRE